MLSATFFRSAFDKLFYMIRMLRSPLPRTMEFLPALIHEHVTVGGVPNHSTNRGARAVPVASLRSRRTSSRLTNDTHVGNARAAVSSSGMIACPTVA